MGFHNMVSTVINKSKHLKINEKKIWQMVFVSE